MGARRSLECVALRRKLRGFGIRAAMAMASGKEARELGIGGRNTRGVPDSRGVCRQDEH